MKLSVVVLNWNGIRYLPELFKSLKYQTFKDSEIIFVDNGSTDGSQSFIRINYPEVKIIQNDKNEGFCKANHQGIEMAWGEYVCLLNNDMILDKNFFKELVSALDKHPEWTAVWAKSFDKYGKKEYRFPGYGTTTILGHCVVLPFLDPKTNDPVDVFGVSGNTMTFRRKEGLPFLEEYFIYSEDAYYSFKTRVMGGTIKKIPKAVCWHVGEHSMSHIQGYKLFLQHRNRQMNLLIFYKWYTLLRIAPLMLIDNILSMIYRWRNIHNLLCANWWLIWNWKFWWDERKKIQKMCKVGDRELFKWMSYGFIDVNDVPKWARLPVGIINALFCAWCTLLFIRTWEMRR